MSAPTFAETLAKLPHVDNIKQIEIYDQYDNLVNTIPNADGKRGSLRLFNYLATLYDNKFDHITAMKGLDLFCEVTKEAIHNPGKHPNIDLLLELANDEDTYYKVNIVYYPEVQPVA